ncbi:MAG: hypothetical protein KY453_03085 [Gemmatimonadetes bacterium]|nr:hypothetical protein [Gemmatimonadota bacterium]
MRWLVLVVGVVMAGCSGNAPGPDANPFDVGATTVTVVVRNQYELDVILHAAGPATTTRLGSVAPGRSTTFQIPWTRPEDLRIRVEPATGPHMESNALTVRPGDAVILTVASDIGRTVLIHGR